MRTRWLLSVLLMFAFLSFTLGGSPVKSQYRKQTLAGDNHISAFVDVSVVPMDKERILRNQTVIVDNGRIKDIGPTAKVKVPGNALRIDGRGKYLMPGLVDMHTHITYNVAEGTPLASDNGELLLYIANGVTTVRNMKGQPKHLQWRKQIASGELLGPALYTCGPTVLGLQDPEEARRVVHEQAKARYDCIKVYSPPDWSKGAYEVLKLLKRPELKYVPLSIRARGESATENSYRKQIPADKFKTIRYIFAFQKKLVKALHDAGVRIMAGTDSSWNLHFVIAGFSIHEELRHLVDAGLTPYQALRAATINPAEFLQAGDEIGTVSVGKRADLILVEGNPVEDVTNASRRVGVMVRGRWLPEVELQGRLQGLAASYAKK